MGKVPPELLKIRRNCTIKPDLAWQRAKAQRKSPKMSADEAQLPNQDKSESWVESEAESFRAPLTYTANYPTGKFYAYTVKLPSEQLAALQSIWLELKRMYGTNSPDKSGMIQQAVTEWLKRWDGPEHQQLLRELLEIRQDTRRRQYRKSL